MGTIHLYTGEGGGKTTSALGVALRSYGWGNKVIVVQFMKGRENGELLAAKKMGKNLIVKQFGRKSFVDLEEPDARDIAIAKDALKFAQKCIKDKPDLLMLDEINLAVAVGLLDESDVIAALEKLDKKTVVYMTGRRAPESFLKIADYVTEIEDIKAPKKMICRKGIEY